MVVKEPIKNKKNNTGVFCRRKVKREFLPVGSSPFSLTAIFGEVATLTFSSIEKNPYVATSPILRIITQVVYI